MYDNGVPHLKRLTEQCTAWPLTLVKPATHPDGSHPLSADKLGSYSGASAVTVVSAPASTEAATTNDGRPARIAARASVFMLRASVALARD